MLTLVNTAELYQTLYTNFMLFEPYLAWHGNFRNVTIYVRNRLHTRI